jgi:hypothetical protein
MNKNAQLRETYWDRIKDLNAVGERGGSIAEIKAAEQAKRAAFEAWSSYSGGLSGVWSNLMGDL